MEVFTWCGSGQHSADCSFDGTSPQLAIRWMFCRSGADSLPELFLIETRPRLANHAVCVALACVLTEYPNNLCPVDLWTFTGRFWRFISAGLLGHIPAVVITVPTNKAALPAVLPCRQLSTSSTQKGPVRSSRKFWKSQIQVLYARLSKISNLESLFSIMQVLKISNPESLKSSARVSKISNSGPLPESRATRKICLYKCHF